MGYARLVRFGLALVFVCLHILQFSAEAWAKTTPAKRSATVRKQVVKKAPTKKRAASKPRYRSYRAAPAAKRGARVQSRRGAQRPRVVKRTRRATLRATRRSPAASARSTAARAAAARTASQAIPGLSATAAFIADPSTSEVLFAKNADQVLPIASITKLMTALIVVEARQPLDEVLTVTRADIDRIKHTTSRLRIGSRLTRADMLHIALMSSENRAASALGRHYPGGQRAFVAAMNAKAKALGMTDTRYVEPTGLSSGNVSSPRDLAKLVAAAQGHPLIREYSTYRNHEVDPGTHPLTYRNSNRLISRANWDIVLQKTGYISEAGRCLVMQTVVNGRTVTMVLLNAQGKYARARDATLLRTWLQRQLARSRSAM